MRRIVFSLIAMVLLYTGALSQSGIIGAGFSTGWTNPANITTMTASAGGTQIAIRTPAGTGNQFFRILRNSTTEMSPSATCTPGGDLNVSANAGASIAAGNTGPCTNGAWFINVANAAHRYVFKTPSNNATNFYYWVIQGTERTVTAVSQSPAATACAGQTVTVTATLSGALSVGQSVYLRYSTNSYATSVVGTMSVSGTTATFVIPSSANTSASTMSYYVFTGPSSGVATNGSNADLFTFNLNNNSGSNYTYSVTTAVSGVAPLGDSPYTQNFNSIGAGLPVNWGTYTGATTTALGTTSPLTATATSWTTLTGQFTNYASANSPATSADNATTQSNSSDRALGVRQTGSFGDPGASFAFQLPNTSGRTGFNMSFKIMSLDAGSARITTWAVDYGLGASPTTWTTVTTSPATLTTGNSLWATTNVSLTLPSGIDGQSGTVWIRIRTTAASTATGNRPTTAIDDLSLSWSLIPPPTITGLSTTNVYTGTQITITGTGLSGLTAATVGGTAATIISQSGTSAVIQVGTGSSGIVSVTNGAGSANSSASVTYLGYITTATGGWNTAATWLGNAVPPNATSTNVTIAHNVTSTTGSVNVGQLTVNASQTLTITAATTVTVNTASTNSGTITNNGTLAVSGVTYTNSGTMTINGTFQINQGGFANGSNFAYGAAGTLAFNNTTGPYGVSNTAVFWPSTSGPFNVSVLGAGGVQLQTGASRTVAGTVAIAAQLNIQSSGLLTVNGTLQINPNGFISGNAPVYGSASTLVYNTGGSFGVATEWDGNSTSAGTGVPNNVTIQGSTTVNFPTTNRGCAGIFTVSSGTASLNVTSGDLYVAGNFVNNGTFTPNSRALFMNGSSAQTISGTGTLAFAFLLINNASGVSLSNNASINASGVLTLNNGLLSLGNNTLTLAAGASVANATSARYIRTNGTGTLIQTVGGTNVTYPIGNSSYNPLTFSNSGTSDTHAVRVVDGALVAANDVTYTINRRWEMTEGTTGGSVITPALTYNSGDENNSTNWAAGTQNYVGLYNGSAWTQVTASQTGAGPFVVTAGSSLAPSTATYSLGLGRDNGLGAAPPTITGISVAAPGSGTSGYVGTTVTVTGTNLASVTILRVGGVGGTAVTIASQTTTTITFTAINLSGQIYAENGAGNATSAATYTNLGYITNASAAYTAGSTWLGGAVPPAASDVTIAHAVTLASAANTANSMTINAASSFTITNAVGAITITTLTNNGTLASSAAGTITIAAGGTLTNNATATMAAGAVVYAGAGTVNGSVATTFFNLTLNGGLTVTTAPTVNNNLTLNSGAFLTAALTYGATSTLIYNTTGTYGVGNEWTGNGTTAGLGIPQNVTIQNTTTVTFPTTNRGCAGNFTITTGGATLNTPTGDLYIAGNFTHNGASATSFVTSGRAVFFNGSAAQTISGTAPGTLTFDYLILNNSSVGGVTFNRSASVIAATGDVLQLLGTGPLNIGTANSVITMSGSGGNILVNGGVRTINTALATNFFDITGTKTVTSSGGGTLAITSTAVGGGVRISAGVNFGSGLTTIGSNAFLTVLAGGFVNTNPVTYASSSTLSFNTGGSYVVGSSDRTWAPGTSGAGVPFNVVVNLAGTNVELTDNRTVTNNLTITAGTLTNNTSTLTVGPTGGGNKVLTVNGGTLTNNGGTLNHNGNVSMSSGAFNMSGGTFTIDGNDGTSGTSVASGIDLFAITATNTITSVTGGTILINDPPFVGTGRAVAFSGSTNNANWTGNTLQLGGSTGTNTSTATNGFNVDTYIGAANLRLGHVIINGGGGASRFVSSSVTAANGFHIAGNLTINTGSELRTISGGSDIWVEGNVVNDGTLTILGVSTNATALNFASRQGGTTVVNSVAQTVSGAGVFQNATSGSTAKFAELIINNTGGVTFNIGEVSVSETVTFTAGVLNVGIANDFVLVGSATQTRTGGYLLRDATAAGFMKRTHSATGSYTYHIGNGGVYAPITLNFTVNSVSRQMGVSVTDATHPDMNNPVAAVDYHSKYWRLFESGAGGSYTLTAALTYNLAGDVNGTENSIRVSGWNGTVWTEYGAGTVVSPVITSASITQATAPTLNDLVLTGRRNPTVIYTWTGGANTTNWADAANWSPNGVPASTDAVLINASATFNLNLTDSRTINALTLNGTGVMNIAATGSLTVNGAVTYVNTATANLACGSTVAFASTTATTIPAWSYGNLTISGGARTWTSGATTNICGNLTTGGVAMTVTGSTVAFNGTAAQAITGNATFETLNISNTSATVSTGSNLTVNLALNVNANATLHNTAGTLTLASGSTNAINGTYRRTGSLTQAGATTTVGTSGTYDHNANGGGLLTATWSTGSTCLISGTTASAPATGLGQAFHHLTWNCPSQTSTIGLAAAITTVNGNLSFLSTGSSGATLNLTGTNALTLNVGGNLVISAANAINTKVNLTSSTGVVNINVLGNFDLSDTGTGVAELSKNGSGAGTINFRRVGAPLAFAQQNYTQNGGVIINNISFVVGAAGPTYSLLQLQTDAALGLNASMTVTSGSAIEFQTFVLTGPSFVLNNGGNLITANVNGITALGNASGSVQTTTTRTFNASCNYTFNGTLAQVTGNGVPATANYLGISNAAGVSLSSPLTLNAPGGLLFNTGTLSLGNNNLIFGAGVSATNASTGNFVVTNGTGRLGHTVGTSAATYNYPLGDITGTAEYSPVSLNFTANSASRVVFMGVTDDTHPNNGAVADFISRYWMSSLSDATGTYSYTPSFTYLAADVNGSTTSMVGNRWGGLTWIEPNATGTAAANTISYSTALDQTTGSLAATAEWTARNSRCTGTPSVSTLSSSAPGPFCDNANTTLSLTTPPSATGFTYQWQNSILGTPGTFSDMIGETNPSILATGTTTLYYQLIATCSFSGLSDTTAVLAVNVFPSPTIAITPSSATSCGGAAVSLAATGGVSYVWSPNYNISSLAGSSVNVTPLLSTTYTVIGTDANGCISSANAVISAAPAVPALTVTSSASPACIGSTVTLGAGTINPVTILTESFNGTAPGWTRTNNTTGGATPAAAAWTQRSSGYNYVDSGAGSTTFTTSDASAFYLTNSDAAGTGVSARTFLTSPAFSLSGYSAASLALNHYYEDNGTASDSAIVQVSTNGLTWTNVQSYQSNVGTETAFATSNISLNAYAGQNTVYVRFYYRAGFDWWWAINSATISGTMNYTYAWTSTPANLNSTLAAPTALVPTSSVFNVVVTNAYGCTNAGSVSVTGVASAEANAGADASSCGGGNYTFSGALAANQTGVLWTTSGLGTLTNASTLTPSYTPHVSEVGGAPVTFTLTANSTAPCSNATDAVSITFNALQNYYPDGDGDGYGSAASLPTQGCTAPLGFVANNTDQCDADIDINPGTEWWLDADGDGVGGYIFDYGNVFSGCAYPDPDGAGPAQFIPYFPAANGNQAYTADCNDTDPNFFPGIEICNNIDDDCDGLIDEGGCAPINDLIQNAIVIQATNPISICTETNGTVAGATISPEATSTVGAGGGQDVWYRFVAASPTVQIRVFNAVGFNPVIELRTGPLNSTTHVDTENAGTGNFETMAVGSLTVGQTYYYAVRSFGNSGGSTFKTCIGNYLPSGCLASQPSIISTCQTFKFISVGATNYTVTFTPTGGSVGGGSLVTTSSFTTANAALNLIPGSSYDITIAAHYSVTDAGGVTQIITRNSASPSCTVTVGAHAVIAVRTSQLCSAPATLLRSTFMRTDPFVCGVTNYTYEFTPVVSCSNNTATGIPFTHNNNSRVIQLNFPGTSTVPSGQTIQQFTFYSVRIRPNFGPGGIYPGTWGSTSIIYIGGSLMAESEGEDQTADATRLMELETEPLLYPNPNNGQSVFLVQEGLTSPVTEIDVFDGMGRKVYSRSIATEGSIQLELLFDNRLTSGIYMVRVKNGMSIRTTPMVVAQ